MSLRLFVAIATLGRPEVVAGTVARLALQTRRPDGVVLAAVTRDDVAAAADALPGAEVALSEKGLCRQRNRALDAVAGRADVVVFLDDDYVPAADFLEQAEALFLARPDLAGLTGRVVADGVLGAGYTVEEAVRLIEADAPPPAYEETMEALYGCNMCVRLSLAEGLRFDEALPLYGWQEDIDFTFQLGRRGLLLKHSRLRGVHMGVKAGRSPGKRLGYSQIANPVYLLRKRTMPKALARRLMTRNVAANLVRSLRPEAHIDRRGRLAGNLMAFRDLLLGRLDPRRILELD